MKSELKFLFIVLFLFSTIIFYLLTQEESFKNVVGLWKVERILINSEDVTNDFNKLYINPIDYENRIIIPNRKDLESQPKIVRWQLLNRDMFNSILEIYDSPQRIFDGKYEIELSSSGKEKTLILSSDSIVLLTRRVSLFQDGGVKIDME